MKLFKSCEIPGAKNGASRKDLVWACQTSFWGAISTVQRIQFPNEGYFLSQSMFIFGVMIKSVTTLLPQKNSGGFVELETTMKITTDSRHSIQFVNLQSKPRTKQCFKIIIFVICCGLRSGVLNQAQELEPDHNSSKRRQCEDVTLIRCEITYQEHASTNQKQEDLVVKSKCIPGVCFIQIVTRQTSYKKKENLGTLRLGLDTSLSFCKMSGNVILTPSRYLGKKNRPFSDGRIVRLRNEKIRRCNPFEADLGRRIKSPAWSPTVMTCPEKTPPQRCWNIDQLSKLDPVDIESSPSSHQECETLSPKTEDRLQEDIRTFFANFKLPSPCGEGSGQSLARHLPGDSSFISNPNFSLCSRRSLELSFNQSLEVSMMSDVSDVEERRVHGGLIKSPNSDEINSSDISMDSPSGTRDLHCPVSSPQPKSPFCLRLDYVPIKSRKEVTTGEGTD
ncbi:unnamed protein product [Allacma fusca]|uniref:Protein aurora borealis n=1 Tax=Allacma fusca TaxID=39272 RepID=A0A8J2LAA5_9HEXA|nr:unnamed protein product [Allacma fusca]